MPYKPNQDAIRRAIEESRQKKKEAISGSPQREVVDSVYGARERSSVAEPESYKLQVAGSIPAAPTNPVCQECGADLFIFSPAMRPYCEDHQHLATEIIDAALDAGCTVIPEPEVSAVLRVVDLAAEIQEWVMGTYRNGILRKWQAEIKGIRDPTKLEYAKGKLEAEYHKAQVLHPKWGQYLKACRESDIAAGLSDPRCPQCAIDVTGNPVKAFDSYHDYIQEHGGKARLCPAHSLAIRAGRVVE